MFVQSIDSFEQLSAHRHRWDELADDCLFQSWTWLSTWWQHYGTDCRLYILLVFDEAEQLKAILPCYLQQSLAHGKVLRLLGDGEVCSDHLGLLVSETDQESAAEAIAAMLFYQSDEWDLVDFSGIDAEGTGLRILVDRLRDSGCLTEITSTERRWSISLPDTWDEFLPLLSKSHRKKLRKLERRILDTDLATWHPVTSTADFDSAWPILIDLHQRRRRSLGEPGCFASPSFANFHEEVARKLLAENRLQLSWLELDGQPAAAEYNLISGTTTYAYQGGVEPEMLDQEPGRLSMIRTIQKAMDEGHREFDLLRGDEPYKAHWRATPHELINVRIASPRHGATMRLRTWTQLRSAGRWAKNFSGMFGSKT